MDVPFRAASRSARLPRARHVLFAAIVAVFVNLGLFASSAGAFTGEEVERGRTVFARCAQCHILPGVQRPPAVLMHRELFGPGAQKRLRNIAEAPNRNG